MNLELSFNKTIDDLKRVERGKDPLHQGSLAEKIVFGTERCEDCPPVVDLAEQVRRNMEDALSDSRWHTGLSDLGEADVRRYGNNHIGGTYDTINGEVGINENVVWEKKTLSRVLTHEATHKLAHENARKRYGSNYPRLKSVEFEEALCETSVDLSYGERSTTYEAYKLQLDRLSAQMNIPRKILTEAYKAGKFEELNLVLVTANDWHTFSEKEKEFFTENLIERCSNSYSHKLTI